MHKCLNADMGRIHFSTQTFHLPREQAAVALGVSVSEFEGFGSLSVFRPPCTLLMYSSQHHFLTFADDLKKALKVLKVERW